MCVVVAFTTSLSLSFLIYQVGHSHPLCLPLGCAKDLKGGIRNVRWLSGTRTQASDTVQAAVLLVPGRVSPKPGTLSPSPGTPYPQHLCAVPPCLPIPPTPSEKMSPCARSPGISSSFEGNSSVQRELGGINIVGQHYQPSNPWAARHGAGKGASK